MATRQGHTLLLMSFSYACSPLHSSRPSSFLLPSFSLSFLPPSLSLSFLPPSFSSPSSLPPSLPLPLSLPHPPSSLPSSLPTPLHCPTSLPSPLPSSASIAHHISLWVHLAGDELVSRPSFQQFYQKLLASLVQDGLHAEAEGVKQVVEGTAALPQTSSWEQPPARRSAHHHFLGVVKTVSSSLTNSNLTHSKLSTGHELFL